MRKLSVSYCVKSMVSYHGVYKNLKYLKDIGLNWSKPSSSLEKHHILHLIDIIFGFIGK